MLQQVYMFLSHGMDKIFILEDDLTRVRTFKYKLSNSELYIVDNVTDGKKVLIQHKFDIIFLDHDLGGKVFVDSNYRNTGYQLAKWMAHENISANRIIIHSLNPVGCENMKAVLPRAEVIPFPNLFPKGAK